jgi:hypothetical protein
VIEGHTKWQGELTDDGSHGSVLDVSELSFRNDIGGKALGDAWKEH